MSYFVFRSALSGGARELADSLGGARLRRFEGGRFFRRREGNHPINVRGGDTVILWGSHLTGVPAGIKTLNNQPLRNKFTDAQILKAAGIPTIEVSTTRPAGRPGNAPVDPAIAIHGQVQDLLEDLVEAQFNRNDLFIRGVNEAYDGLNRLVLALRTPAPAAPLIAATDWVGRVNNHTGGTDLLTPPGNPDFWVKKLELVKEYRIHMFLSKSIRAGVKTIREGFSDNPAMVRGDTRIASKWVRSYDGGWTIKYDDFKSKHAMRELAHKAVTALKLDFGAVDIGEKANGELVVLEVNRAPGLEGGTVDAYSKAITTWSQGQWQVVDYTQPRPARRRAA